MPHVSSLHFWGKTNDQGGWHPLPYHCLDVAAVVHALLRADHRLSALVDRLSPLPSDVTRKLLLFFAAVHDVGKFAPTFQHKVPELEQTALAPLSWLAAGLFIVADWLGSNERWFPHAVPGPQAFPAPARMSPVRPGTVSLSGHLEHHWHFHFTRNIASISATRTKAPALNGGKRGVGKQFCGLATHNPAGHHAPSGVDAQANHHHTFHPPVAGLRRVGRARGIQGARLAVVAAIAARPVGSDAFTARAGLS